MDEQDNYIQLLEQAFHRACSQRDALLTAARDVIDSPPNMGPDTDHVRVTALSFARLRTLVDGIRP